MCEDAESLIHDHLQAANPANRLQVVDIATDAELMERYGVKIPVLRHEESGLELNWPFTQNDVQKLLTEATVDPHDSASRGDRPFQPEVAQAIHQPPDARKR